MFKVLALWHEQTDIIYQDMYGTLHIVATKKSLCCNSHEMESLVILECILECSNRVTASFEKASFEKASTRLMHSKEHSKEYSKVFAICKV